LEVPTACCIIYFSNETIEVILIKLTHVATMNGEKGLNEIIGATRAIEGSAYWIALVVSWMQTLGFQPVMPKMSPITGTRGLHKL
jgi:hypothetical protein